MLKDDEYRELANRLFAMMTAMLEDATEPAVAGQSARLTLSQLADHGRRLRAVMGDIEIIAEAATIVASPSANHPSNQRKRPR